MAWRGGSRSNSMTEEEEEASAKGALYTFGRRTLDSLTNSFVEKGEEGGGREKERESEDGGRKREREREGPPTD